jgi:alkaline phosphatase D
MFFRGLVQFFFFWMMLSPALLAQGLVQSGPMVGYSAKREALLWVQTKGSAQVYFEYWDQALPKTRYRTEIYATQKGEAYTAKLVADQLLPGKKYAYELFVNGKKQTFPYPLAFQSQAHWEYRTDPPAFKFAFGSCNFVNDSLYDRPGRAYGGEYGIYQAIYNEKPDFMLWGGDNIYLREGDFDSQTGVFHRNTHTRSTPELQPLWANTHHYAIWDDHDFGPNDSDGSYVYKSMTERAFQLFWGNPNYGPATEGKGCNGSFKWNDVEFFLLDNRYFRTANENHAQPRQMIGKAQMDWLINALAVSEAPFKFVVIGCQVLNPAVVYENYSTYAEERAELLRLVREANLKGVFFLSGDRHHTELTMLKESPRRYPLYDLTASPLTSGVSMSATNEANTLRVPGTLVQERNFALMEVSGPRRDRKLKIKIMNKDSKVLWEREIAAKELE